MRISLVNRLCGDALENKLLPWPDVMVKSSSGTKLFLVLVLVMANVVRMAPTYAPQLEIEDYESNPRNERSANTSHMPGPGHKIRLFIKNHYLQIFPDGTVNGTEDFNLYSKFHISCLHLRWVAKL